MKTGQVSCPVEKRLGNGRRRYKDGLHIQYVNAEVDDDSEIARLMRYFLTADPRDMSHGALSERVRFLKCEEEGKQVMCEVTARFWRDGYKQGKRKGERKGKRNGKMEMAGRLAAMGMTLDVIAQAANESRDLVAQWVQKPVR